MLSADQQEPSSVGAAGAMLFIEVSMCDLVDGHVEPEHVPNGYIRYAGSLRVQQVLPYVPQLQPFCCMCPALKYFWCYLC